MNKCHFKENIVLGLPFNDRGRDPLLVSPLIRHKDGGGVRGGLLSPPVFKEGLGVVFPLLSKSDDYRSIPQIKSASGGFNHYSK
jgi:hypothetical protein